MDCKKISKYLSDISDFRLPDKMKKRFDLHIAECADCARDLEITNKTRILLKEAYPGACAPFGFSKRVMYAVNAKPAGSSYAPAAVRLKRVLMPVASIAACAVLLLGLYFEGAFLPALPFEDDTRIEALHGDVVPEDTAAADEKPYLDDEMPLAQAEAQEEPDSLPHIPALEESTENIPASQNGQTDDTPSDALAEETPVVTPTAEAQIYALSENGNDSLASPVHTRDEPSATNGYSFTSAAAPAEIVPLGKEPLETVLTVTEIPDPSVFVPRKRVIDAISVNLFVRRIDGVLPKVEDTELLFDLKPEITSTELRADGTLVMMKSYAVPSWLASSFVSHMRILGDTSKVQRASVDLTSEYSRMIRQHSVLFGNVTASGKGAAELNELVADMMFIDKITGNEVQNVVVWIEDGVDF